MKPTPSPANAPPAVSDFDEPFFSFIQERIRCFIYNFPNTTKYLGNLKNCCLSPYEITGYNQYSPPEKHRIS
jgi:hypothetical protein